MRAFVATHLQRTFTFARDLFLALLTWPTGKILGHSDTFWAAPMGAKSFRIGDSLSGPKRPLERYASWLIPSGRSFLLEALFWSGWGAWR
jgi:hypothetical protein